jgi:tetratricopeptide (TPR) repeat protein
LEWQLAFAGLRNGALEGRFKLLIPIRLIRLIYVMPSSPIALPAPRLAAGNGVLAARANPDGGALSSNKILISLLLLIAFLCYGNILVNGFVYDDDQQILQNPYVKSWHYLPQIFGTTVWSFVGQAGATNYYRPLMTLSFLVLWQVFGPLPFGFHLFSILVNTLVVFLVFDVGCRLFNDRRIAWIGALLFAVHPIHTEAVDWIAALPDLEAAVFLLLAIWLFAKPGPMEWKRQFGVLAAFSLALLAKEPSLMLVPLAIMFEHGVSGDRQTTTLTEKISRYAPLCVLGVAYLVLRILLFGKVAPVLQHPQITWPQAIYSGFALILNYTKLLVWPNRLSAFHVFHASISLFDPRVLSGLGVVLLCILGIFALRKTPAAAFALLWIGVTLAPVLNARWMAANVLTERYLYLPSVGFCWLLAWCAVRLWESKLSAALSSSARHITLGLLLGATIVVAAVRIITRNRDWQNDLTLYTCTLQTDPDAHVIRSNLAGVYFDFHDYARAGREWEAALAGKPDNVVTMNALGILYTQEGRYAEAAAMFQRAFAARPLWGSPHYNYALLLQKTGDHSQALAEFHKSIELAPLNSQARRYYAEELASLGQYPEAELQFRKSVDLEPSYSALRGLAALYLKTNQTRLAETTLRRVLAESPYDSDSHLQLGQLLEEGGRREEARKEYQAVFLTDPANSQARAALKRLQSE